MWSMDKRHEWAMLNFGGTWVRLDRVVAVQPSSGSSRIKLTSGHEVVVNGTPDDVVARIARAMNGQGDQ